MSKEKNNKELDSQDNKYTQLAKENEIIEEIINTPLLLKDIEYLEEEEEEEDCDPEKDKITKEIVDNKLSIIIPEENESKQNENKNIKKDSQKIHKDIIDNLLIELFEYHYNDDIYPQKKK